MEVVGKSKTEIWTSSVEAAQAPFVIVHLNTYTPAIIPVTEEVALEGVVMDGMFGPLISDHAPAPLVGAFPARDVDVTLQRLWSDPALDVVGKSEIVI